MEQESSMSFQKIVLVIAIIALILTISVIGYMMYYSAQSKPYPPSYPACPDMWDLTGTNVCTNTASSAGYFSNVGSFLTDISCSLTSDSPNLCNGITNWGSISSNWVQGNSANKRDASNNYLMASFGTTGITRTGGGGTVVYKIPDKISHTLVSSLSDNVDWAKAYGITWDGLN
jgi:hypothetical protein